MIISGKYTWLEREYEDEGGSSKSPRKEKGKAKEKEEDDDEEQKEEDIIPDSKQPVEVQSLVSFIFNTECVVKYILVLANWYPAS